MKKYIFIVAMLIWALGISISEAQQQWLPGMISNGYVLCQDGMGRPIIDLNAPAIPWSEVVKMGHNGNQKPSPPVAAHQTPRAEQTVSKKSSGGSALCNWGWNDPATGECVNPWEGALPPAQVYRVNHTTDNLERDRRRKGGIIIRSQGDEGIVIKSE